MIGNSQKSKSILFTSQMSTITDDPSSQRLQEKISKVTIELEGSYKTYLSDAQTINKDVSPNQVLLKTELNRLISANSDKQQKAQRLKDEIDILTKEKLGDTEGFSVTAKEISDSVQEKLEKELVKALSENEFVESEHNSIKRMLRKSKESILVLRERLQELNDAHRKLTKSHDQADYASKKAWNNLALVQNQIRQLRKENKERKLEYRTSYGLKKSYQQEKLKGINSLICQISRDSLNQSERQLKGLLLKDELKQTLERYDKGQIIIQKDLDYIAIVEQKLQIIKKVLERAGLDKLKCLDSEGEALIISSFNQLKYQESSLSSNFQLLTADSQEKKKEYKKYHNKLMKIIEANKEFLDSTYGFSQTFNQLKEKLENNPKVISISEAALRSEESILTIYLDNLNILTLSMKFLTRTSEQCEKMDISLFQYLRSANLQIDSLKKGFMFKQGIQRLKKAQHNRKPAQKLTDINELIPEYSNQEALSYFSLSHRVIQKCVKKKFGSSPVCEKFAKFIKKQPMLYCFISPLLLLNFLNSCTSIEDAYINIEKLLQTGHSEYLMQYQKLISITLEIMKKVRDETERENLLIQKFYERYSADDPSFLEKVDSIPRRKSLRMPTVIKDKVKVKIIMNEENRDQLPAKQYEPSVKTNKKSHEFDENKKKGNYKSMPLLSLESPNAVLKEVLRIEDQIKKIKRKEFMAEIREASKDLDGVKLMKKPWSLRSTRPKTQEKSLKKRFISIGFSTPRLKTGNSYNMI